MVSGGSASLLVTPEAQLPVSTVLALTKVRAVQRLRFLPAAPAFLRALPPPEGTTAQGPDVASTQCVASTCGHRSRGSAEMEPP
jgi:hypothetical protein